MYLCEVLVYKIPKGVSPFGGGALRAGEEYQEAHEGF